MGRGIGGKARERIEWLCKRIQEVEEPHQFTQLVSELNDLLEHGQGAVASLKFPFPEPVDHNPYRLLEKTAWLPDLLASSIAATSADFGNIQVFDSSQQVLRIVAQNGFESEFLNYFATVGYDDDCACGAAMKNRSRIVVADAATDPLFSGESRAVLLNAKVRSVQSTPLVGPSGEFIGIVSTHYQHPQGPSPEMWKSLDALVSRFMTKTPVVC